MGVHDGHRERMKKRFIEHGLDNFSDINVLELLLFYALPRRDTNALAHKLLERFGSLRGVLEAPVDELEQVEGVGESAAALLRLVPQVSRRYMMSLGDSRNELSSSAAAGRYVVPLFMYEREEVVFMLCLDSRCKLINCREIGRGVVNCAQVSVRRVVEQALSQSAVSVVLAHNHVDGLAIPSREDELTTRRIQEALALVGVTLSDHIIVSGEDFVSLADSGLIPR